MTKKRMSHILRSGLLDRVDISVHVRTVHSQLQRCLRIVTLRFITSSFKH